VWRCVQLDELASTVLTRDDRTVQYSTVVGVVVIRVIREHWTTAAAAAAAAVGTVCIQYTLVIVLLL